MGYMSKLAMGIVLLSFTQVSVAQTAKRNISIQKTTDAIKIDGLLTEPIWKKLPAADQFTQLRPSPFVVENKANGSEVYFAYDKDGIYVGGYFHESNKDSIAAELAGRDGFGNNDFAGIIFDTYNDHLNGFEYFITPLGEQWDAKLSPNGENNEDFSWNAVWKSAAVMHNDGWSFEFFLPYSCIRFGKNKVQNWGLNIVRRRQKSGQQLFWQSIDPNVNGFLTQAGMLNGLENIKAPIRLQFSPYLSTYINHDPAKSGAAQNTKTINGGMDVKYGLNPAFTLDMTLVPDFGQVQSDNRTLNLTPFEQQFSENRTFFTEGTELFSKGDLFYSRRIGRIGSGPSHYDDASQNLNPGEVITENPEQVKLINATKVSGRTQKGLGIGVLNAITSSTKATIQNPNTKTQRFFETEPLTNYNVLVLDQTMKHNSSISFVNTNVWRDGQDYDANVSAFLFDLNDKTNTWNVGGKLSASALMNSKSPNVVGYSHSIYFGKTSGHLNFNINQERIDQQYNKSDLGYFTNNNTLDHNLWVGYTWTKPTKWYNRLRVNFNAYHSLLVTPLDQVYGKDKMYQGAGININSNVQLKNLWFVGFNTNYNFDYNDFYEPRVTGRVFSNKGSRNFNVWWESNSAKKLSWGGNFNVGAGSVTKRRNVNIGLYGKIRFSSKFSIDGQTDIEILNDGVGWAETIIGPTGQKEVIFARRDVRGVENVLNIKYSFTNKMGLTARVRHSWSKVAPQQFFVLNKEGDLENPNFLYNNNRNVNYNYFTVDMVYNWQFAQGSFFSIVWKDIAEDFKRSFEKDYFSNVGHITSQSAFNSLSVRVIYFLDYLSLKRKKSQA